MALLEKQLYVKKSTIPNAGKGLFTKKFIPKGARVLEYKGIISTWKDVKDEDGRNGYIFYVKRHHVINAAPTLKALARYANDANGLTKVKGLKNNCDYETEDLRAFIVALRDIPAGSEILVDYGKDYWKVIRENRKLWAKEAKDKEKKEKAKAKKEAAKAKKAEAKAKKNGKTSKHASKVNARKVKKAAGKRVAA
jgi:uncharacterized protein